MAVRIPMLPSEVPVQGYRIDIPLPPRPSDFVSVLWNRAEHSSLVPERMPPSASPLAKLEWSWSPMNSAILSFHLSLNRAGTHWIAWRAFLDDNEFPWRWDREPCLLAERGTVTRDAACVFLLHDCLAWLRDEMDYDRFHMIDSAGVLGVHRVEALGDLVWNL